MSSSPEFQASSQLSVAGQAGRKSRFTYKHLSLLGAGSASSPLRAIAHIDLDAFYAQCEMVRLGVAEDRPLAVRQWDGLIAINYPARAFGLGRHIAAAEARKLCPDIILQHVATWKEGEARWAYRADAHAHLDTHKVSLDPYRRESRRILACIREHLPPSLQRVEKASIDEVFLDLSRHGHALLLQRHPELAGPAPYDDPSEQLPGPPTSALDWQADELVGLAAAHAETDAPDWDDVALLVASEIVRDLRAAIRALLGYTCSAGVARNKMLAKLGSGHRKPSQQTVVRSRAIRPFLAGFKVTKIRSLGGKLGDQVVATWGSESIDELLRVPLDQMKLKLGDDTGAWLWQTIRGEDHSEVNSRTQIQSMLSAKSFRPSINSFDQAARWLRIFAADIFARLVEDGVLEHRRRPKTINLHHRQGGVMRSKQLPIPTGRTVDETTLFELAKTLMGQIIVDGRAWPCANLSLSVGGFEDGPSGNRGIGGFLVKGDEAKALYGTRQPLDEQHVGVTEPPGKRRRVDGVGIQKFLRRDEHSRGSDTMDDDLDALGQGDEHLEGHGLSRDLQGQQNAAVEKLFLSEDEDEDEHEQGGPSTTVTARQLSLDTFLCQRCSASIPTDQRAEHEDWHFAQDLQASEGAPPSRPVSTKPKAGRPPKGQHRSGGRIEKGQQKLAFG